MLGELTLCLTLTRCKPIYLITSAQSRSFVAFALHRRVELPSCLVGLKLAAGGNNQMRWVPARAILTTAALTLATLTMASQRCAG